MAAGNDGGDAAESLPGCIRGNGAVDLFTVGAVDCNIICDLTRILGPRSIG